MQNEQFLITFTFNLFQDGSGFRSDWKLKLAAFKISNPNFELNDEYYEKFLKYTQQGPMNCGCGGNKSDEVGEHHDRDEIVFVHNEFIKAGEVVDILLGIINTDNKHLILEQKCLNFPR